MSFKIVRIPIPVSKQPVDKSWFSAKTVLSINAPEAPKVFDPHKREGSASLPDVSTKCPVTILCVTGAGKSMIQMKSVPGTDQAYTGERAVAAALRSRVPCAVAEVYLESIIYTGFLKVLVTDQRVQK